MLQDSVKSLVSSNAISVLPGTKILIAIDIIISNNFSGIPVTDKDGVLLGIVTKYDLIIKRGYINDETIVGDVMNKDPLFLTDNMTVEDAIRSFSEHHKVDPIPVIDENRKLVGVISRLDMVRMFREYGIEPVSKSSSGSGNKSRSSIAWLLPVLAIVAGAIYYFFFY